MSKKDQDQNKPESQQEETAEEAVQEEQAAEPTPEEALQASLREQEDKYLRLLAEYDNYRKRS